MGKYWFCKNHGVWTHFDRVRRTRVCLDGSVWCLTEWILV